MILFFAVAIAAFLVLAYFGAPVLAWTIVGGALLWYLSVVAAFGYVTNVVLGALFVIVAAVLNIRWLRRVVFTDHVLAVYRRILPDMSQTEKEAIDAGTVWWDADLFSGKPDWNKLLAVRAPRLSPDEQAFLDGPVEELCAMCDDWQITHELQDLPPHVWQYIKDQGFLGMIIPKRYGGLRFSALPPHKVAGGWYPRGRYAVWQGTSRGAPGIRRAPDSWASDVPRAPNVGV